MPVMTPVRGPQSPIRSGSLPAPRPRASTASRVLRGVTLVVLGILVAADVLLLLVAVVPQSIWANYGYPNGPIPHTLSPVVAGLFYVLPSLIGALCRRWIPAVVLATLPAWLDLGAFAIAAAGRVGPFYLAQDIHAASTVGTLELFAALGALGWLARTALLALFRRGEWGRR